MASHRAGLATTTLLACGALAGPLFTLTWVVESVTRAGYDPLRHPISSLELGSGLGWVQQVNFVVAGLLSLAFAVGLRRALRPLGGSTWGPLLVGAFAIGLVGAGVFVADPISGYPPGTPGRPQAYGSLHGGLHDAFAVLTFLGLPAACAVFARRFAGWGWRGWALYSAATGSTFFAAFVVTNLAFAQTPGLVAFGGLFQRLCVIIGWAWLTLLAVQTWMASAERETAINLGDPVSPATGEVRSGDGTRIAYDRVGHGPAVILLHGAGQSSQNLSRLAGTLADAFTVYVPDRRGRARSGPYGEFHGLRTEIEDLSALLDASGARYVFGLSAGAVIAIEAALVRPDIVKLALYEPPLSFDGVIHGEWALDYERKLGAGRPGAALVTVLKATADRTSLIRFAPQFLIAAPLDFVINRTANRPAPVGAMSTPELIQTVRHDAQTVREASGPLGRFAKLTCEVFLLGGSRSARNLTASLDGLHSVLPRAKRTMLQGEGHTAPDNSRQPGRVAAELLGFFGRPGAGAGSPSPVSSTGREQRRRARRPAFPGRP